MISFRWKTADSETKSYFGSLAMADVIRFKTEVSEKVESHTQSQACSAITYTNFGDNAQNADILRVIQKAPSQALATFNQVKETNRAIRKYDQNEATVHALQTTPETIFPTSVGEVSKNPRNNQKRKTTGLSGQNDLCRTESFLGQKRSMTEVDVAHNRVANKRFVPLPVFSFNNQGEVGKDVMSCEGLQSNNRVDPPSFDPNRVLDLYDEMRELHFALNTSIVSHNESYHPFLSSGSPPFPIIPQPTAHNISRPTVSLHDLHSLQQIYFSQNRRAHTFTKANIDIL